MNKLYGFKEKDIKALARYVREGGFNGKTLTQGFKDYAAISGKAAGSVRNLYYALAALSNQNEQFTLCQLNGAAIKVSKAKTFSDDEKQALDKITEMHRNGVSVRKATLTVAEGDAKKALRYQNKFRAEKRFFAARNLAADGKILPVNEFLVERLKREINRLADGLSASLKRENVALKRQVSLLNYENARLNEELRVSKGRRGTEEYFRRLGFEHAVKTIHP